MRRAPSFSTQIIVGALLVTAIVGITTMWVTNGARSAANDAANKVTEFYLQEFAGRRSQMVSAAIDEEFDQMHRALQIIDPQDLTSQETLRNFLAKVETAYGTGRFAIVDEDDVVYTRYATYSGGSRYDFLSGGTLQRGEVVSATDLYGASKQVCLAIPVSGLSFMGKELKACFVQVDIESIVAGLALDSDEGKTFFGLHYGNGENLTELDFGPFAADENLLEAMRGSLDANTWDALQKDFYEGRQGGVEFSYNGVRQTLYYSSIPDTNWMLTVLVADDMIQSQVRSIGDEMAVRSNIQILVTAAALLIYFGAIIARTRKTSAAMLAIERQNTRNAGERAQKSEQELGEVKQIAYKDALTGAKSRYAYTEEETVIDEAIAQGKALSLAVVVCDVNGLKHINDTRGHAEGDKYIRSAYKLICEVYASSPVFRVGGDEFAVLVRDEDFERRNELLNYLNQRVEKNMEGGEVVVAAGMADLEPKDEQLYVAFHRADQRMYARKAELKNMGAQVRE